MLWLLKFPRALPCPDAKSLSRKFSWPRQFLTLPASQFKHMWADAGKTAEIYNNHPLAIMNPARRSMVLQDWARKMLEETTTNCLVQDPIPGKCIDGTRRGVHNAEYDFLLNGRRVEVKSSQLRWDRSVRKWKVSFGGVRFGAFDDLFLVIFSPHGLDLIKHDQKTGISKPGVATECRGSQVTIHGEAEWQNSIDIIVCKLCEGGNSFHLCRTTIAESACKTLRGRHDGCTRQFYQEVPLAFMNPTVRGLRVERMVMEVDRLMNSNSIFAEPGPEYTIDGERRGKHRASYDWSRDGKRIEVKHSQLSFSSAKRMWYCAFHGVKHACFDELLLVIYSPSGLDIFKHDGFYGLHDAGVRTETVGRQIEVKVCADDMNSLSALKMIQAKLVSNGCPHLAQILWDS